MCKDKIKRELFKVEYDYASNKSWGYIDYKALMEKGIDFYFFKPICDYSCCLIRGYNNNEID